MKSLTVGEFKSRFSEALDLVRGGQSVAVTYGRGKRLVGIFAPATDSRKTRRLGLQRGRVSVDIGPDWEITDEEFLKR